MTPAQIRADDFFFYCTVVRARPFTMVVQRLDGAWTLVLGDSGPAPKWCNDFLRPRLPLSDGSHMACLLLRGANIKPIRNREFHPIEKGMPSILCGRILPG